MYVNNVNNVLIESSFAYFEGFIVEILFNNVTVSWILVNTKLTEESLKLTRQSLNLIKNTMHSRILYCIPIPSCYKKRDNSKTTEN